MKILSKTSDDICKNTDTIQRCYNIEKEDKECFSQKQVLQISGSAQKAALEGNTDLSVCGTQIVDDENDRYSTFPWLEFVTSDNKCSEEEKKEADDILDNCLEAETELFYQEMIHIQSWAKKIWSCSVLEKTVWKCTRRSSSLPECFSPREKYFLADQLSSLVATIFHKEKCSFFQSITGRRAFKYDISMITQILCPNSRRFKPTHHKKDNVICKERPIRSKMHYILDKNKAS